MLKSAHLARRFRCSALLGLVGLCATGPAWGLDPRTAPAQYVHEVWQTVDGLPVSSVTRVTRTRDGYLWLGTEEGLARFDGARFVVLSTESHPGLGGNNITALQEARQEGLWIGTQGGLSLLRDGRVVTYSGEHGLLHPRVRSLREDSQGDLWIATHGGLNVRPHGQDRFQAYTTADGLPDAVVRSVFPDSRGRIWVGSTEALTVWTRGQSGRLELQQRFPRPRVVAILEDRGGALWFGGSLGGLARLGPDGTWTEHATDDATPGSAPRGIFSLHEDRDGQLWVGTSRGLGLFRDGELRFPDFGKPLSTNWITSLAGDAEGSLWIGVDMGGLHRFRDTAAKSYTAAQGLPSQDALWSVHGDSQGNVWMATVQAGLVRLRGEQVTLYSRRDGLAADNVEAVLVDRRARVWASSGVGLSVLEAGRMRTYGPKQRLPSAPIRSLYEDLDGTVWLGTGSGGLVHAEGDRFTTFTVKDGLPDNHVSAILRDREGALWVGTDGGLLGWKGAERQVYTTRHGLGRNAIYSLHEDTDGYLWISTRDGGLSQLKGGRIVTFTSRQGLLSDRIYQILEDDEGHLWMSCAKGIFRVPKRELHELATGRRTAVTPAVFGTLDGMASEECSGASQPAGWKGPDGRLWFPTIRGAVVIDPRRIPVNRIAPPVYLEEMVADGQVFPPVADRRLEAGTSDLELHYTAPSLLVPERVRFRYRLEGFDRQWIEAGTRRVAYYSHLPPGQYLFRVKASNNDGVWNEEGARLEFTVAPFFYQTLSFRTLVAAALLAAAFAAHRLRVARLARRQTELTRLVEERTRDISVAQRQTEDAKRRLEDVNRTLEHRVAEGIAALREAEQMAAYGRMVAGVAHEVRNPLLALQTSAYVLRAGLDERPELDSQLRVVESETRRIGGLVEDLLEFARPQALLLGPVSAAELLEEAVRLFRAECPGLEIRIEVEATPNLPRVFLDRSRMLQVLLNLMHNARKHARGLTRIHLSATLTDGERLCLAVRNDGQGIAPEDRARIFEPFFTTGGGTGLGLAIVRRIVAEHEGTISVESEPVTGTVFKALLPVAGPPSHQRQADAGSDLDTSRRFGLERSATDAEGGPIGQRSSRDV